MQFSIKSLKLDSSSSIAWRAQIQSKECFRQRNFALLNNSLLPPAAETISSVASATSAVSAASAAALAAASASCALPTTHFSSSAPEPNQVQSQRKNKSDTASASSAVAPKGINYSCGSHAASPTSIEVRPCHRSFRVSGLEAVPEEAEGGGP